MTPPACSMSVLVLNAPFACATIPLAVETKAYDANCAWRIATQSAANGGDRNQDRPLRPAVPSVRGKANQPLDANI
jgi:hypothetical protein